MRHWKILLSSIVTSALTATVILWLNAPAPASSSGSLQTPVRQAPIQVVSAAKYKTLEEAFAKERFLYIPPGTHKVNKPIVVRGWRGGLILGAGRLTSTLVSESKEPALRFLDCRDVLLANLSFGTVPAPKEGGPLVEIAGSERVAITLAGVSIEGGIKLVKETGKTSGEGGRVGLRVEAPGKVYLQGCHFIGCSIGLEIDHAGASVAVLGGNFQSEQVHIRQTQGILEARSIGFQLAFDGADVEIHKPSSGRPHLIEGCRSEGLDTFLRVPNTKEPVHVVLKANSMHLRRMASYRGCGTLVVLGNNMSPSRAKVGIEAPALSGPCQILSYGNYYGDGSKARETFALGAKVRVFSVGDLWKAPRPEPKGKELFNRIIDATAYKEAGCKIPAGLTFPNAPPHTPLLEGSHFEEPVTLPPIANIDELYVNVKKYGAVGDGRTDDSEALARAVKEEKYKPLFFPAGRYRLSKPIVLDHWRGGTFWGEGPDKSVLVSDKGESVVRTNGCAYSTFVGLTFEAVKGGKSPAFDLDYDGSVIPGTGPALQANLFYHCRFQGGVSGLEIGKGEFMGSENLFVDCTFQDAGRGMGVNNYNALTNTALSCLFMDLDVGVQQHSGSFNLYDCTLRNIRRAGAVLSNSASDTFVFERINMPNTACLLSTANTGAIMNVMVQQCNFSRGGQALASAVEYLSSGTVSLLNSDLGNRRVVLRGGIAPSTLIQMNNKFAEQKQFEIRGHARSYRAAPR